VSPSVRQGVEQRIQRTTARGRTYEFKGEQFWSVTTLIKGGLRAPALERWTPREVAKFAIANHRQIGAMFTGWQWEKIDAKLDPADADRIRKAVGLDPRKLGPRGGTIEDGDALWIAREDPNAIDAAIGYLLNAPYRDKGRRADIGTAVHRELEAYALDQARPPAPLTVARHVEHFRSWLEVFHPRILMAEATVYNRTEAYAGRLDAIVSIGDYTWLLDYTTTRSGVYAEKAYQCCAYARAEFVGLPDGAEIPMPEVDGALVLHLSEEGWALFPVVIDDDVWRDFRIIREAFDIVEVRSKRIVGRPIYTMAELNSLTGRWGPALEAVEDVPVSPIVEPEAEPVAEEDE